MARPKLSQAQVIAVHTMMAPHCRKNGSGMAVYEADWSDERIVREMESCNPEPTRPIALSAVRNLRLHIFGRVRQKNAEAEAQSVKVQELEQRVRVLEEYVAKLATWLQQQKIAAPVGRYTPPPGRPQSTPPEEAMNVR